MMWDLLLVALIVLPLPLSGAFLGPLPHIALWISAYAALLVTLEWHQSLATMLAFSGPNAAVFSSFILYLGCLLVVLLGVAASWAAVGSPAGEARSISWRVLGLLAGIVSGLIMSSNLLRFIYVLSPSLEWRLALVESVVSKYLIALAPHINLLPIAALLLASLVILDRRRRQRFRLRPTRAVDRQPVPSYCGNCGSIAPPDAAFCGSCGQAL